MTVTAEAPALRAIVLDALHDAYWVQRVEVEECPRCRQAPAGVCADRDHQDALALALDYEAARRQIQDRPDALAAITGENITAAAAAGDGGE